MLLDLSQPRKEYFKRWTAHQILVQFLEKKRFLPRDLLEVEKSAVMTMEGNLEALVDGESYNKDHFEMVDKVNSADRDTLLVFPPSYRVPAGDSRSIIAYRYNSLVPLHPFRNQQKKASEVVKDAFDKLHEERDQFMSRELIGYSWLGEDGLLRVVPFMNDIKGQELRAFQNLAWYQLEFPELEERVLDELSAGELKDDSRMVQKVKKYHAHLGSQRREGDTLQHYVNQLEVRLRDTIRISLIEQRA
ncbi:hypothetical protein HYX12_00050 [Candidatus Woesearchaeota archaeon]|nr:hypothetical protein [Candidatus Woesearchaeota archaeon]